MELEPFLPQYSASKAYKNGDVSQQGIQQRNHPNGNVYPQSVYSNPA